MLERARWWAVRPAQNHKPVTYTCPICGGLLASMSPHMLLTPDGDSSRRRHAHTECVLRARRAGKLPLRAEFEATQPRAPSLWRRLLRR
jgi:hypothetical protein